MTEQDPQTPSERDALKDIEARLDAFRRETPAARKTSEGSHSVGQLMWLAFNVVSELIAGVVCGFGIGYGIDYWLGTRPAFIAVFLIFGCMAGIVNVVRFLRQYEERQQEKRSASEGKE